LPGTPRKSQAWDIRLVWRRHSCPRANPARQFQSLQNPNWERAVESHLSKSAKGGAPGGVERCRLFGRPLLEKREKWRTRSYFGQC
jgi:hypothetical protein